MQTSLPISVPISNFLQQVSPPTSIFNDFSGCVSVHGESSLTQAILGDVSLLEPYLPQPVWQAHLSHASTPPHGEVQPQLSEPVLLMFSNRAHILYFRQGQHVISFFLPEQPKNPYVTANF